MGLGGISVWQLLIVLLIVVAIFGTKRLKDVGGDLGAAVKGFRKAMSDADQGRDEPKQLGRADAEFTEAGDSKRDAERGRSA